VVNFYGEFRNSLDSKNRVMLPSRLREQASGASEWVLTRGLDNCLALYTPSRWDDLMEKMGEASFTKKKARQFQRMLFSKALKVECDKNGRLLIPEYLKKLAFLEKKIVFAGLADHIELWDEKCWDDMQKEMAGDFEKLAEDLFT
jgi:MraZ protein